MKKVLIITLTIFAIGVSGCAVSTGTEGFVDDAAVGMPDGDVSSPFTVEPADEAGEEIDDEVVVEEDDVDVEADDDAVEADDSAEVELITDGGDVDLIAESGEFYSQTFKVADHGAEYEWDVTGLPSGSGLVLEEIDSNASKVKLEGTLTSAAVGTHDVTVTVWDAADPSKEDSMSFTFIVGSNIDPVVIDLPPDPCDKPLTIEVVKVGNYVDPEILNAAEFTFKIGSKVDIEVRARRGLLPPKGSVTWEIASEVEKSEHCFLGVDTMDFGDNHIPVSYDYGWIFGETCIGGNVLPQPAIEGNGLEIRKTTNPFWVKDSGPADVTPAFGSYNTTLKVKGRLLYDGPLPVWNLPLDRNAVERLTITARDECDYSEETRGSTGYKALKFGIAYPDTVGSKGGDMTDLKAYLEYNEVNQYWNGGDGPFKLECDVEEQYEPVCKAHSDLAIVFTDSDGLSDQAIDIFEGTWDLIPALKESVGYVHYDFKKCDDSHDNCDMKRVKRGDVKSSVLDASKVYLLWVAPPKLSGGDTHYADFNIKKITFKNKYWYAKFRDEDDDFNNNITKNFTRLDRLWHFDGMTSRVKRFSDDSSGSVLFHRRELAGWTPLPNQ